MRNHLKSTFFAVIKRLVGRTFLPEFPLYVRSKIQGLFKDFQGPQGYIFKD